MIDIVRYEHAGIRVSDRDTALDFYSRLGFRISAEFEDSPAVELENDHGVRLNLISNAVSRPNNVLQDEEIKHPGITHVAFVVPSLQRAIAAVNSECWQITEGPKETGRRRYFFIRDPDGNVIELNELKSPFLK